MHPINAITRLRTEYFRDLLALLDVTKYTATDLMRMMSEVRNDRARIITLLKLSGQPFDPLLVQAIAVGWSTAELLLNARKRDVLDMLRDARRKKGKRGAILVSQARDLSASPFGYGSPAESPSARSPRRRASDHAAAPPASGCADAAKHRSATA